jgi:hypothetical protein
MMKSSPSRTARVCSEVRAGARLGVALAPAGLALDHLWQEFRLLLVRAVHHDRGTHVRHAQSRRARLSEGLVENELLHRCQLAAAVFLRPCGSDPALFDQLVAPLLDCLRALLARALVHASPVGVVADLQRLGQILVQEVPNLSPERRLFGGISKINHL